MSGTAKRLIDQLIAERSKGNATIATTTKTKLMLKGLSPDSYSANTPDDPIVIAKVCAAAQDMGITLTGVRF